MVRAEAVRQTGVLLVSIGCVSSVHYGMCVQACDSTVYGLCTCSRMNKPLVIDDTWFANLLVHRVFIYWKQFLRTWLLLGMVCYFGFHT